ncbi:MAG: hypothetical protein M1290_05490 [Candidatus Thermoplasmatota archaeon]|nr:hypothetical protein [Candidatus Thermoplasmatota archaeon]MCL5789898.1 hypothetical protein [Candidatus Thermoplasmatota archaeon]
MNSDSLISSLKTMKHFTNFSSSSFPMYDSSIDLTAATLSSMSSVSDFSLSGFRTASAFLFLNLLISLLFMSLIFQYTLTFLA